MCLPPSVLAWVWRGRFVGVHTHVALSPQGESLPFFFFFFVPCFSPDFQLCFELVFWQLLRNECSFCFSLLQVPINRQATEGKISESHHSNPVCNPILREPRKLKRGEKNRE